VFTARYGLIPYIKQIKFFSKSLNLSYKNTVRVTHLTDPVASTTFIIRMTFLSLQNINVGRGSCKISPVTKQQATKLYEGSNNSTV